ncbi:MAG: ribosome maturation factor RimP [Clostridia bacterium]|nr:ribosome maturation factor RimP [Clostridia bacterium]
MGTGKSAGGNTVAICYALAAPVAEELGLTLWDVRFVKEGAQWYLRYIIDKEGGVDINDCATLSRKISPILDEKDPIPQSYCLEVMSPGIERELTRPEHFEAYLDWPVVVRLIRPLDNVREFAGYLRSYANNTVTIEEEDGTVRSFQKKEIALVHVLDDVDGLDDEDIDE